MNRKEYIDISHYFVARPGSDNLEEIYKLISAIIQSERMKNYRTIDFKIGIWEPYSQLQNLTSLRLVRKIIIELSIMDSTLTETDLNLPKKIHDCGLLYIRTGKLEGDQLLSFLGFEEAFYVDGQINSIIETLKLQQKQLDDHLRTINFLVDENNKLKGRVNVLENDVSFLKRGELFEAISEQGAFTEEDCAHIMKQVLSAVNYLHSKNIMHRDIKPENIMLTKKISKKKIKNLK